MRYAATIAVVDFFIHAGYDPILIVGKDFSGFPGVSISLLLFIANFYKRLINKHLNCIYSIFIRMFFQMLDNTYPKIRLHVVKDSAAKNDVIVILQPVIIKICLEKINMRSCLLCKALPFFDSILRQIKCCNLISISCKKYRTDRFCRGK